MKEALSANGVKVEFIDIFENPMKMKMFLKIRDTAEEFADAREKHYIGIPCMIYEKQIIIPHGPDDALEKIGVLK